MPQPCSPFTFTIEPTKRDKNRYSPDIYDINSIVKYRNRDFRIVKFHMRMPRILWYFDRPVLTFYCFFFLFFSILWNFFFIDRVWYYSLCPFLHSMHYRVDFIFLLRRHQQKCHHIGWNWWLFEWNFIISLRHRIEISLYPLCVFCPCVKLTEAYIPSAPNDTYHIYHVVIDNSTAKTEFNQQIFRGVDLPVVDSMLSHPLCNKTDSQR